MITNSNGTKRLESTDLVTLDNFNAVFDSLDSTKADINSFNVKLPCICATTANITLSGLQTLDGVTVVSGDRVLVRSQTTSSQNGIYIAYSGSWIRATDSDTSDKLAGAIVLVEKGTTLSSYIFANNFKVTDTLGTTSVTWYSPIVSGRVPINNTSAISGTLPVSNGGTGATATTQGGIVYGSSTTAYATTAAGTTGFVLRSNGTSAPTWTQEFYSNSYSTTQTLSQTNDIVFLTASAAWTLTLPSPIAGKRFTLVRTDATAFVISVTGHINGVAATTNTTFFPASTANRVVELVSNGTSWYATQVSTITY